MRWCGLFLTGKFLWEPESIKRGPQNPVTRKNIPGDREIPLLLRRVCFVVRGWYLRLSVTHGKDFLGSGESKPPLAKATATRVTQSRCHWFQRASPLSSQKTMQFLRNAHNYGSRRVTIFNSQRLKPCQCHFDRNETVRDEITILQFLAITCLYIAQGIPYTRLTWLRNISLMLFNCYKYSYYVHLNSHHHTAYLYPSDNRFIIMKLKNILLIYLTSEVKEIPI